MSQTVNPVGHEHTQRMSSEASDFYLESGRYLNMTETGVVLGNPFLVRFPTSNDRTALHLSRRAATVAAAPLSSRGMCLLKSGLREGESSTAVLSRRDRGGRGERAAHANSPEGTALLKELHPVTPRGGAGGDSSPRTHTESRCLKFRFEDETVPLCASF